MTASPVTVLHVSDCPLVTELVALIQECLDQTGDARTVETEVGDYPSPTLVVDGIDVATGLEVHQGAYCRLDLPSREQILAALEHSLASPSSDLS